MKEAGCLQFIINHVQYGMRVRTRVSFLNNDYFRPAPHQTKRWDRRIQKHVLPSRNAIWEKEDLQRWYYYLTSRLKYGIEVMLPVHLASLTPLDWIFRQFKVTLRYPWRRNDGQVFAVWQFMKGKPGWGKIVVEFNYLDYPESRQAPPGFTW